MEVASKIVLLGSGHDLIMMPPRKLSLPYCTSLLPTAVR